LKQASRGQLLAGWGRATWSSAQVRAPSNQAEVERIVLGGLEGFGHFVPRGLGRAYGDAAQCAGGLVMDCRGLRSFLDVDKESSTVRAAAGVSFDELLEFLVPQGYFLPVTPGTRFVTLGGAIASDIHGKNHHVDGALSAHLENLRLVAPSGVLDCGPVEQRDEFWATCGGMGLTGVITEATLRLLPVESSWMVVDIERAPDLEACLSLLSSDPASYRYSVAWVDGLAGGKRLGRGVLTRANHASAAQLPAAAARKPLSYRPPRVAKFPCSLPVSALNPATVRMFNEMWYRKAPVGRQTRLQQLSSFFYPLDGVASWNKLYGPRGFTQYQFAVPFGEEQALEEVLEMLSRGRVASFLAVLKSFGAGAAGPLSFPIEGWALALDIPLGVPGLPELLDRFDTFVANAGGRVYLSKDARLRPALLPTMYPRLEEWKAVRDRLDPAGLLSSDMARRLGLVHLLQGGR
jgi:decaprenylphospho-beta-D-ribofuranose 2-oxidase